MMTHDVIVLCIMIYFFFWAWALAQHFNKKLHNGFCEHYTYFTLKATYKSSNSQLLENIYAGF